MPSQYRIFGMYEVYSWILGLNATHSRVVKYQIRGTLLDWSLGFSTSDKRQFRHSIDSTVVPSLVIFG